MTSSDVLAGIDGFTTQRALWGYVVQGDICEISAIVCEKRNGEWMPEVWDRKAADLAESMVSHGDEPYHRVADWWALPWVGEHVVRGHAPWPDAGAEVSDGG